MTTPYDISTTIVARATPPGRGSIAIVRLSGDRSFEIADLIFHPSSPPERFSHHTPRTLVNGTLILPVDDGSDAIDNPLAVRFIAPHSFTGEDVVELHLHGNPLLVELVIDACIALGAHAATPGEFSRRAFLHGKMDLTQVEALGSLIESESRTALRASQGQLAGELHLRISDFRIQLLHFLSLLELELDFVEEGYSLIPLAEIEQNLLSFHTHILHLLTDAQRSRPATRGPRVLIAGKPNAGKSSLFNALLGQTRAIVSDIPGTTRDYIEATLFYDGTLYHLYDSAGIRLTTDPIEELGIATVYRLLNDIDLLIYLVDFSQSPSAISDDLHEATSLISHQNLSTTESILLLSKTDSGDHSVDEMLLSQPEFVFSTTLSFSISRPDTIHRLLSTIHRISTNTDSATSLTTDRQRMILERLNAHLTSLLATSLFTPSFTDTEILSSEIRHILSTLDEFSGSSISEEILDTIFARFCIGK